jgi:hypothetical protein
VTRASRAPRYPWTACPHCTFPYDAANSLYGTAVPRYVKDDRDFGFRTPNLCSARLTVFLSAVSSLNPNKPHRTPPRLAPPRSPNRVDLGDSDDSRAASRFNATFSVPCSAAGAGGVLRWQREAEAEGGGPAPFALLWGKGAASAAVWLCTNTGAVAVRSGPRSMHAEAQGRRRLQDVRPIVRGIEEMRNTVTERRRPRSALAAICRPRSCDPSGRHLPRSFRAQDPATPCTPPHHSPPSPAGHSLLFKVTSAYTGRYVLPWLQNSARMAVSSGAGCGTCESACHPAGSSQIGIRSAGGLSWENLAQSSNRVGRLCSSARRGRRG